MTLMVTFPPHDYFVLSSFLLLHLGQKLKELQTFSSFLYPDEMETQTHMTLVVGVGSHRGVAFVDGSQ